MGSAKIYYHPAAHIGYAKRPPITEANGAIGALLQERRYDKGYTQVQVADWLGRSQGWLSRLENGRFVRLPPAQEMCDLCRILGTNRAEIMEAGEFVTEVEMLEYLETREALSRQRGRR